MSDVTVNHHLLGLKGVKVHVEDNGSNGRPVVFVHGWPLSSESWCDQLPALRHAGYRTIAYDTRGFGLSDRPLTGYDYDTLADDLAGLIERLNLTDVTLVGLSMGCGEIARYTERHGTSRLRSIVFTSTITPMMMNTRDNPDGSLEQTTADATIARLRNDKDAFIDDFATEFFSFHGAGAMLTTDAQREQMIKWCRQADKNAMLQTFETFREADFRQDLKKIGLPTLIIHGDADGLAPLESTGMRTHQAIPQSELHVIPGGPSGINISHPEEYNLALLEFLKK